MPVELSLETLRRLRVLFVEPEWASAEKILVEECGNNLPLLEHYNAAQLERVRFAALKISDGTLSKLRIAAELAKTDSRDLLMGAGFGGDPDSYTTWQPVPQHSQKRIDTEAIRTQLSLMLSELLAPLGLRKRENSWGRGGAVRQVVRLIETLGGHRGNCQFLLEIEFNAPPLAATTRIPRGQPNRADEQGYTFSVDVDPADAFRTFETDVREQLVPLLRRLTNRSAIQQGLREGSLYVA